MTRSNPRWLEKRGSVFRLRASKLVLLSSDLLAFLFAAVLAATFAVTLTGHGSFANWMESQELARYLAWGGVVLAGLVLFLARFQHYAERKPFWTELGELLLNLFWLALLDLALLSLTRWNASRLWWVLVWMQAATFLPLFRALARSLMTRLGLWQRPTVIIGTGPNASEAVHALNSEPQLGLRVLGCIDGNEADEGLNAPATLPPAMTTEQLLDLTEHAGLQVVIALEHHQSAQREAWLRRLAVWNVADVCVIPAMRGIPLYGTDIAWFFSHEVALLRVRNNLRRWPARFTKRLFDITASTVLLVLLLPLMLWTAIRIRRDGGHAIFAHHRVGRQGRRFPCFKFRSMVTDAEERLQTLLEESPELKAQWDRDHKIKDDPRISPVGHFLRRTSLDELPQLFNVLRGEMSLVGPRPVIAAELERYGDDAQYYLMVRPGITGLWQVSGRNDVDYDTRVYLDTWYVKNWSMWYDIAILFKTLRVVIRRDGAY